MKQPLASIITPCYNGEKFVSRFLDSVLAQTYKNIELIIINDGSTDKTEEIILSYKTEFEARGIQFIYLCQKNKGQAAALNQGLKIFKGKYLTWPDSDDILYKNYISSKVDFLEKNREIGILISKCRILVEGNLNQIGTLQRIPSKEGIDNLFYDLIVQKNVFFAPGGYMISSKKFLESNPKRFIYESRIGQNWQMLLPIAYHTPCGYINDYLYDYIVRENSHSRQEKSEKDILNKLNNHEETLLITIKGMNIKDEATYLNIIKERYMQLRLHSAFKFNNKELFKKEYFLLKENKLLNKRIILKNIIFKYQPLYLLFNIVRKTIILFKTLNYPKGNK